MSENCKWLHEVLEDLPTMKYPFDLKELPRNGIYFFYEEGEYWGHGGKKLRIVRIGTHKKQNFRNRIAEHFMVGKNLEFNRFDPKPSDRSIFRKNIGRAILNMKQDDYLRIWNIDFTTKANRKNFAHLRDIEKERKIESEITEIIRTKFMFRFIIIENEDLRIGSSGLERKLIGTVSNCNLCRPSENWFGKYSPIRKIRESGLWLTQYLNKYEIDEHDRALITHLIDYTKTRINKLSSIR